MHDILIPDMVGGIPLWYGRFLNECFYIGDSDSDSNVFCFIVATIQQVVKISVV